jgi:UMP-CMP kinase
MSKPVVVFVLGGPGAGKGTQCARIVEEFGFVHLSAGDLLRAERKNGGEKGELINNYIKEGKIIPVAITIGLIKAAMEEAGKTGKTKFLIDGFPRNEDNLNGWNEIMDSVCDVRFTLFLDCPEQVMQERLLGRDEGRADDNIESIKKRFVTYMESTMPIIKRFDAMGKTRKIDSSPSPDKVYEEVQKLFAEFKAPAAQTYGGQCNCGAVKFTFECKEKPMFVGLCHCLSCRNLSSGSAPHLVGIKDDELKFTGEDNLGEYAPGKMFFRFCKTCGSPVCQGPKGAGFTAVFASRFDFAMKKFPEIPAIFKPNAHLNFENALIPDLFKNDGLVKFKCFPGGETM